MSVDISVQKKPGIKFRQLVIVAMAVVALIPVVNWLWVLSDAEQTINKDVLTIASVQSGDFTVSVRGNGVLVPENIQWLSVSLEVAKVEKVLVKPGNIVRSGQLIIELSHPQLVKRLAEQRWELEAMEAEAKAARVSEESRLLEQESEVLNARLNYESSLLKHEAEQTLMSQNNGAVSRLTYERTKLETLQFKQRWDISLKRLNKMQENLVAQENARVARQQKATKLMESLQQQVDELQVRASMDSIILEVPVEPGQRVGLGTNIAKLAEQNKLIAELQIPEIQIGKVSPGQAVLLDTRNNLIAGEVSRVDPSVINGNVQVDVLITEDLPPDARPDLSVTGEITITQLDNTLYVERPLFAQSQSLTTIYKLNLAGDFAQRTEITTGYGSVNKIQILNGLEVGEQIIISDPTHFERFQTFRIN